MATFELTQCPKTIRFITKALRVLLLSPLGCTFGGVYHFAAILPVQKPDSIKLNML